MVIRWNNVSQIHQERTKNRTNVDIEGSVKAVQGMTGRHNALNRTTVHSLLNCRLVSWRARG
jgi:poly-beta-hydroxyalkanoate depolymerase